MTFLSADPFKAGRPRRGRRQIAKHFPSKELTDRVGVVTLFLETAIGPYPFIQSARRDAVALPFNLEPLNCELK